MLRKRPLPLIVTGAAAVAVLVAVFLARSEQAARALPPAGRDNLNATAHASIVSRLGSEEIDLAGRVTLETSDPRMEGGVEVADVEVVDMLLEGESITGPVSVGVLGGVPSQGELRSLQPPPDQFPASSTIDVFVEADVPASPAIDAPLLLHNDVPFVMVPTEGGTLTFGGTETSLSAWPPVGVTYSMEPVFGFDNDGDGAVDEDTADEDGDIIADEDRPGADPPSPFRGRGCGNDADCDGSDGEDPPPDLCNDPDAPVCDADGDGLIDEDPSCIALLNPTGTHYPAGVCVRDLSITFGEVKVDTPTPTECPPEICTPTPTPTATGTGTAGPPTLTPTPTLPPLPENPSYSVAAGGPSGFGPADLLSHGFDAPPPGTVDVSGNDDFADAWSITSLPFTGQQNTAAMTTETGEPLNPNNCIRFAPNRMGHTAWYRFTAPADGNVTLSTDGSNFDTVMAVYTGSAVDALSPVACDDDAGPGLLSELNIPVDAGTTYRVQVGGFDVASGDLMLLVSAPTGGGVSGLTAQPGISCAALGLTADGCDGTDGDQDDLDALSYGEDLFPAPAERGYAFSVAPGSLGLAGSAAAAQAACSPPQPQADEFASLLRGTNTLVFDGDGANGGCPTATSFGLTERPTSDNLDALTGEPTSFVDSNRDGALEEPVFFSLASGSPTLTALSRSPADVLWTVGFQPGVYVSHTVLGLQMDDNIDALCVRDEGDGAFYDDSVDVVRFSLAAGSPSLASLGASPADVLGPGPEVIVPASVLGLRAGDDLNALKCFTEDLPEPNGDVSCDGTTNAIDATLILQLGAGLLASLACEQNGDVNGDGRVDSIDASLVLQFVAGLIDQLPP